MGGTSKTDDENKVITDDDEKKNSGRNCCKKVLKFLFSHIGLCGMVIAYSVLGGFIFQHLEQTNERMECEKAYEKYDPAENDTMNKLWKIADAYKNPDEESEALKQFQLVLRNFRKIVLDLQYDGDNCSLYGQPDGPQYKWNFPGALLFSVTVITTIGYGNIAPKTFWGRLVCIAYAVLGIPLMLLCLANIGDVLADVFRFVYTKVCCCGCCRRKDKNKVENLQKDKGRTSPEAWKENYDKEKNANKSSPPVIDDDEDEEDDPEDEKISVPLTITMAIIGIYIFFGALLFGVWEGWNPLKASYFCFVTISTIGFGDVVPGSAEFENAADQWKMIGAAVYMLFGMAILSMCFSLIQEEIVAKFRWVGEKLGILEKDKHEDLEEEDENGTDEKKPGNNKDGYNVNGKEDPGYQTPKKTMPTVSASPTLSKGGIPMKK